MSGNQQQLQLLTLKTPWSDVPEPFIAVASAVGPKNLELRLTVFKELTKRVIEVQLEVQREERVFSGEPERSKYLKDRT